MRLEDGKELKADKVILSTGAGTHKLLADSAPKRPELQVDGRMVAAAVVTGIANLSAQEGKRYTEIPVTVYAIKTTRGGVMPLTAPLSEKESYRVKFAKIKATKILAFTNRRDKSFRCRGSEGSSPAVAE